MISSLLFTILALVFFTLMMVINFYRRLFMDGRETYSRSELLSITDNIIDEVKLWYNKDKRSALVGAGIGLVAGIIYSVLGGLYGYFYESYLFLSCSGPLIFYFFMPQIKEALYNLNAGLGKMASYEIPFLVVFNVTVPPKWSALTLPFCFELRFYHLTLLLSWGYRCIPYRYEEDQLQLNEQTLKKKSSEA